jgi:2-keto-3-deoxy-galactonokinase
MFNLQNYIAVDWGSSNLRLWLFQQGEAIWTYHSREGVTTNDRARLKSSGSPSSHGVRIHWPLTPLSS